MKKTGSKVLIFTKSICLYAVFPVVCVFLSANVPVLAQARAVVRVSAETEIAGDRVTLGDMAAIAADGDAANRLKAVSLGYAPSVGMTREVRRDQIALAIAAAGFAAADFRLEAPARMIVRRTAQAVASDSLREAIETAVLADFQNENITAQITRIDLPPDVQVAAGKLDVRVNKPAAANFFAPFAVSLEILVNGRIVRRLSANVSIEATAAVLVAADDLAAGEKIAAPDFKTETRRLEKPLSHYLRDPERLRGMVLVKNLAAGQTLTTDATAAGYVVRTGDLVRIVGESGKTRITVSGEARASGRIGDRIAVKNAASGAILQAVVIDEAMVKVLF